MSKLHVNEKTFSSDKKILYVDKPLYLDFTKCTIDDYPKSKIDFKEIIETFKAFKSKNDLKAKDDHKLKKEDIGKKSDRIMPMINQYEKVKSLDVYHRQGKKGKIRMLYTKDDSLGIAYILDCFIDTH